MRRLPLIAAFFLFLAVPLWAQHGGGHSGGSHGGSVGHGGVSSGRGSFGGHSSPGRASGGGPSRGINRGSNFAHNGLSRSSHFRNGFRGNRFRAYGLRNNCYGYACRAYGYPWWGAGYYDPSWWWDSGSRFDEDNERDRQIAAQMEQQSIEQQQARERQDQQSDHDDYRGPYRNDRDDYGARAAAPDSGTIAATVLVFRDQHTREIQNYAIVGLTLWNLSAARKEKIALADLDIAATEKANDDRGVTFRVPAVNQGQ